MIIIKINIEELFSSEIAREEKAYYIEQFRRLEEGFRNSEFNFDKFKVDDKYKIVLEKYISYKGYGYLTKQIKKINHKDYKDHKKLAKLLIDSKLIKYPNIKGVSEVKSREIIEFEEAYGLDKSFTIKYEVDSVPFNIESIDYINNEYVKCIIEVSGK